MEEIRGPAGRTMWDKLGNVNEAVLANYLKNEYPQTVAVVLSKIKSDHAGRVLTQLPESFAMEVIMRMLRMEAVQKEVLDDVERTLRTEFFSNLARTNRRDATSSSPRSSTASTATPRRASSPRSRSATATAPSASRRLMFTFEDLGKLDGGAIQALLRAAEKEKLPLALKGASDALRDLFFSNMSERAGKILREDIAGMGPVRLKDVEEAQSLLVSARQGSRGERRDHHRRRQRRRRAGVSEPRMATPHKFLFDASFDHLEQPRRCARPPAEPPLHPRRDRGDARRPRSPRATRRRSPRPRNRRSRSTADSLAAIAAASPRCIEAQDAHARCDAERRRDGDRDADDHRARLVPALCRKDPLAEVEALRRRNCLHEAIDEPRIVLRVAEMLFEPCSERLDDARQRRRLCRQIVLLADDATRRRRRPRRMGRWRRRARPRRA